MNRLGITEEILPNKISIHDNIRYEDNIQYNDKTGTTTNQAFQGSSYSDEEPFLLLLTS